MKESLSQQQELRQQQRLSPMQVQFVKMLEMTGPEVEAAVAQAVDDMPALEVVDPGVAEAADRDEDGNPFDETADDVARGDYSDDETPAYLANARNRSADDPYYEPSAVNDEESLEESLESQLGQLNLSERQRLIACYIIGNIDPNGYLMRTSAQIADDVSIALSDDISTAEVDEVLKAVRTLDPAGVGAVDLRDCLLLQLRRRQPSPATELATEIVAHYFDLFSKRHFKQLADALDVDTDTLRGAMDVISKLNPKPGAQHGDTAMERTARMIVPELAVDVEGDRLTVSLLNNIPELAISETFADDSAAAGAIGRERAEALAFVRTRRDEAANFIKTLQMRQSTLFNVMTAIARLQREFFLTGDETKLRPMILKDVAALTGYDLSVISRATASKYVMTPAGTYPLKFFFNERQKVDDDTTSHQIAASIREIIGAEDKSAPLSDEAITAQLRARGIDIARRTVAKYRERLGYPVGRLRRAID